MGFGVWLSSFLFGSCLGLVFGSVQFGVVWSS